MVSRTNFENKMEPSVQTRRSPDIDRGYAWAIMTIVYLNYAFCGIPFGSYSVLYGDFLNAFTGSTVTAVGSVMSIYLLSLHLTGMLSNAAIKWFSIRTTSTLGSCLSAASLCAAAFSPNLVILGICYTLTGIGVGFTYVSVASNLQQHFDRKRVLASGVVAAGFSLSNFMSPLLARYFLDVYGWRGTLALLSALYMQNIWLCLLHRPLRKESKQPAAVKLNKQDSVSIEKIESPKDNPVVDTAKNGNAISVNTENTEDKSSSTGTGNCLCARVFASVFDAELLTNAEFLIFGIATICMHFGYVCAQLQFVNKALQEGIDKTYAAFIPSLTGAINFVFRPISGILITKFRLNRLAVFSGFIIGTGVFYFCMGLSKLYWQLLMFTALSALCNAISVVNMHPVLVDLVGIEKITSAIGLHGLFCAIGLVSGGPFSGWMFNIFGSFDWSFYAAGIAEVVSGLLMALILLIIKTRTKTQSFVEADIENSTLPAGTYQAKDLKTDQVAMTNRETLKSENSQLGSGWSISAI